MAADEQTLSNMNEEIKWTPQNELLLLDAMFGYKPVGINKHFDMACICEKFATLVGRDIPSQSIWEYLSTLYNLTLLDENEWVQFPNEVVEFSLPEAEFSDLIAKKFKDTEGLPVVEHEESAPITPKTIKDYSRNKEIKKETVKVENPKELSKVESTKETKKIVARKNSSSSDTPIKKEKKDNSIVESEKKETPKDTKKKTGKDKELETPSTPVVAKSQEDSESSVKPRSRQTAKGQRPKRTLRSKGDEESSSPAPTPPPVKRARRI